MLVELPYATPQPIKPISPIPTSSTRPRCADAIVLAEYFVFYRILFAWQRQGGIPPLVPLMGEVCIPPWTQMCQRHIPSITPHKRSAVWGCNGKQLYASRRDAFSVMIGST